MLNYYIVDVETTGLKAGFHEMTEISIVRCSDRNQLTKQIKAEYPERANSIALEKTGRSLVDILEGDSKEEVIKAFNDFLEEDGKTSEHRCMIAHNASFDRRFIHATWSELNQEFPANHWLCTMKFSKNWAKKLGSPPDNYQLHTILKFANIDPMPGMHDAGSDARNTYLLWKKGMDNNIDHLSAIKRIPHKLGD